MCMCNELHITPIAMPDTILIDAAQEGVVN